MEEAFILDQRAQATGTKEESPEISHQVINATSLYLKEIGYAPLLTAEQEVFMPVSFIRAVNHRAIP